MMIATKKRSFKTLKWSNSGLPASLNSVLSLSHFSHLLPQISSWSMKKYTCLHIYTLPYSLCWFKHHKSRIPKMFGQKIFSLYLFNSNHWAATISTSYIFLILLVYDLNSTVKVAIFDTVFECWFSFKRIHFSGVFFFSQELKICEQIIFWRSFFICSILKHFCCHCY